MYEKHWNDFFYDNTDPIPHIHPCTDTRIRRTCGPKIGFIKEVEILYLCLILLKPIFYYKLIIDNDSNLIVYHHVNLLIIFIDILYFDVLLRKNWIKCQEFITFVWKKKLNSGTL